MIETADQVLEHLCSDYGGATAVRAVWQWAGGQAHDVDYHGDPQELWEELWERAGAGQGPVSHLTITRELLHDQPGNPILLQYLAEVAATHHEESLLSVDWLQFSLERLRRSQFPLIPLRTYLLAFPADSWEAAFSALAPALHEWAGQESRDLLERSCRQLSELNDVVQQMASLRATLRDVEDADTSPAKELASVRAAIAELKQLNELVAGWNEGDPTVARVQEGMRRIVMRLEFRKKPTAKMAIASLTSFLVPLNKMRGDEDEAHRLTAVLKGLLGALWGTRAEELEDEEAAWGDVEPEDDEGAFEAAALAE